MPKTSGLPPQIVYRGRVVHTDENVWKEYPDAGLTLFKRLSDNEFAVGYFNFADVSGEVPFIFADAGLPYQSGFGLHLTDAADGRDLGVHRDYFHAKLEGHESRVLIARLERV